MLSFLPFRGPHNNKRPQGCVSASQTWNESMDSFHQALAAVAVLNRPLATSTTLASDVPTCCVRGGSPSPDHLPAEFKRWRQLLLGPVVCLPPVALQVDMHLLCDVVCILICTGSGCLVLGRTKTEKHM